MTALAHDGNVVWVWVPAVASVSAPTITELNAGFQIPLITNYDTPSSENEVDVSDIDTLYDTSVVGTTKAGPITLTMKRDDGSETQTWNAFTLKDTGFLIKSKEGYPAVSDVVECYPVQVGQRRPAGYSRNTAQMFDVSFYVTSAPSLDAVIAAGS